ncbi:MAG: GDP-mannose 4,6-dehydratase [Chloroflexi bacterium]|nr:GDP-mannose 4,6-dehydratase [Chloroflexota bacterium]
MRVLITGITGMAGSHLAEFLLEQGEIQVYGTYRPRSRFDNLDGLREQGRLRILEGKIDSPADLRERNKPDAANLLEVDLTDPWSTLRLVRAVQPERIFHLAAQSFVLVSFAAPAQTLEANIAMQLNLFEAVREEGSAGAVRIHIAGSSEEYGLVHDYEVPIRESNPLRPLSPYAVSKVTQEMLAYQYNQSYGLHTVVTRGFNHTGPRRGEVFATSSFAKQIAEIEAGLRPPVVYVGDLEPKRDWTDVRDMVRAYWLALEHCPPGEVYNTGSENAFRVGDMLQTLIGLSRVEIKVQRDETRLRPSDVPILYSDCTKFKEATGWQPEIPFEQTLRDLLDYWRARIARGSGARGTTTGAR